MDETFVDNFTYESKEQLKHWTKREVESVNFWKTYGNIH